MASLGFTPSWAAGLRTEAAGGAWAGRLGGGRAVARRASVTRDRDAWADRRARPIDTTRLTMDADGRTDVHRTPTRGGRSSTRSTQRRWSTSRSGSGSRRLHHGARWPSPGRWSPPAARAAPDGGTVRAWRDIVMSWTMCLARHRPEWPCQVRWRRSGAASTTHSPRRAARAYLARGWLTLGVGSRPPKAE